MNKKDRDQGGTINPLDWEKYEQNGEELYSYLKKKGKHKRAEKDTSNKSIR